MSKLIHYFRICLIKFSLQKFPRWKSDHLNQMGYFKPNFPGMVSVKMYFAKTFFRTGFKNLIKSLSSDSSSKRIFIGIERRQLTISIYAGLVQFSRPKHIICKCPTAIHFGPMNVLSLLISFTE